LIPSYLSDYPTDRYVFLDNSDLSIHAGLPHTYITYCFREGGEGWWAGGDFGPNGPLPLPKVTPSHRILDGEERIKARLAEYDRRIAESTAKGSQWEIRRHYTQKIAFLNSAKRIDEAAKTCKTAAAACPDWWLPLMTLAISAKGDAAASEQAFRTWVAEHPTFIHYWYLSRYYRDRDSHDEAVAALREAVKCPRLEDKGDHFWNPTAFAFDAASYACQRRLPELVLEICRLWELPREGYSADDNIHAFRAAAELALGRFAGATAALHRLDGVNTQSLWTGNLEQLKEAVDSRIKNFIYDPGPPVTEWVLFPALEQ
jgi:hypothetical protein